MRVTFRASGYMKKKMRAALLHEIGEQLSIETVKVPKLKANEVTIKIMATGICDLDINYCDAYAPLFPFLKKFRWHVCLLCDSVKKIFPTVDTS